MIKQGLGQGTTGIEALDFALIDALVEVTGDPYLKSKQLTQDQWKAVINHTYDLCEVLVDRNDVTDGALSLTLEEWGYTIIGKKSTGNGKGATKTFVILAAVAVILLGLGRKK